MSVDERLGLRLGRVGARLHPRQVQDEHRPLADRALDADLAAGLLREAEDLAQSEARSLADVLGREERLEDVLDLIGGDAGPRVLDAYRDEVATDRRVAANRRNDRDGMHSDGEGALAVHGVPGIDGHVHEGRVELARVGVDEAGLVREVGDHLDARTAQGADHVADGGDALAGVEDLGLQGLPAREGQQLTRELGGAVDRVGDRADVALAALLRQVRPLEQVGGGLDDGQQVVEVVRHATGELADGLHLLGLPQGLLSGSKLRFPCLGKCQVPAHGDEVGAVGLGCHRPLDGLPSAVEGGDAVLEACRLSRRRHSRKGRQRGAHVVGVHEGRVRPRQEFGLGPAENPGPGRADRRHHPLVVGPGQHVLGQRPELVALGRTLGDLQRQGRVQDLECVLHALALGDVREEHGDPVRGRVADPQGPNVEPASKHIGPVLDVRGFSRQGDATVGVEPASFEVWGEVADPAADHVGAGLAFEGGVGLDDAIVDSPVRIVEPHLDDAEPDVDALEQGAIAALALRQGGL